VLVGAARKELPTVLHALRRAGKRGIGSRRAPFHVEETDVLEAGAPEGAGALPALPPEGVRLQFETPVRLRYQRSEVRRGPLPAGAVVRALCRRLGTLADYHAPELVQPDWPAVARLVDDSLHLHGRLTWFEWARRSLVQERDMTLTGLVGPVDWPDVPPALWPLLVLGSRLHIGKNASLGLGRYTIVALGGVQR
jgi:hypothetical protein